MRVNETSHFRRDFRQLAKKYPSLIDEIRQIRADLLDNPQMGQPIGMSCYKIRVPIRSKGTGKRGGARIVTYVQLVEEDIYLLTIYDKSEQSDISDKDILKIIESLGE